VAFDIYPYNNCGGDPNEKVTCGQFWVNAFGVDRLHPWSNRSQAVWTDIERTTIAAVTTAGPTSTQLRSEVWLALIDGANGITYFVHSWAPTLREDGIFASAPIVAAVKVRNQQVKSLGPVLNSANVPGVLTVASSNGAAPVDCDGQGEGAAAVRVRGGLEGRDTLGTFTIAGMTGDATRARRVSERPRIGAVMDSRPGDRGTLPAGAAPPGRPVA
jgi:hypothetical protein